MAIIIWVLLLVRHQSFYVVGANEIKAHSSFIFACGRDKVARVNSYGEKLRERIISDFAMDRPLTGNDTKLPAGQHYGSTNVTSKPSASKFAKISFSEFVR